MNKLILLMVALFATMQLSGQSRTITGTVFDETGLPLIGATVVAQSGSGGSQNGTTSDMDGNFRLEIADGVSTLSVSYIGYQTSVVDISGLTRVDVHLQLSTEQLDEVVVTALGIKKEKKALGYAFADVDGESLTTNRDVNFINSISNKVAGVNISQTAGGAGTSSRIIIRGIKSLSTESQPLIVVDGIPLDNASDGATWLGGVDYGNSLMGINPDDVETMSVLKGPNAAALYGSRGATGVILITTKKGSRNRPMSITVNSNFMIDKAYLVADYQNKYGVGFGGNIIKQALPPDWAEEFQMDSAYFSHSVGSWGPEMDGSWEVLNWNGKFTTLTPQPDNVKDYFETGYTATNSVSIQKGSEDYNWRMSIASLNNKGLKPNSTYDRYNASFIMDSKVNKFLDVSFKGSYIREDAFNRVNQGNSESGAKTFIWMPRSINIHELREDYMDENGNEQNYYYADNLHTNPYWEAYENINNDYKDQFGGFIKLDIQITPWLKGFVRSNIDTYTTKRYLRIANGAIRANGEGSFTERWVNYKSLNHDFMFTADRSFGKDWTLAANFGGNIYQSFVEYQSTTIQGLAVPNFFSINNPKYPDDTSVGTSKNQKRINSIYGAAQIQYKNWLFLELTGRNAWSSTLPAGNNSYFYPSVNTSFVFTDAFAVENNILSFGKLRFSYAFVGNDTYPYATSYSFINEKYGDLPTVYLQNRGFKVDLQPERTGSWEVGGDFRFWMNRLSLDLTYYNETTFDQIVAAEVTASSGFTTITTNGGEISNKGVEIQMNVTPVRTTNFNWELTFNFAKNKNEVLSLADGLEEFPITSTSQIRIVAVPGQPYGQIQGRGIKKYYKTDAEGIILDDPNNGRPMVDATGMYIQESPMVIGNINPDWAGGVSSNMSYKNLSLSFSIGVSRGGDIYSKTNKYGMDQGQFTGTLEGRDSWYNGTPEERLAGEVGYVADAVYVDEATGEVSENTFGVDPQFYHHQRKWGGIAEMDIFDASYVKLRDVTLNYKLPANWFTNNFIQSATVSLVGKNLWLIYSGAPNIDPESSFTSNNAGIGQEYAAMPTTRSMGLNLRIIF